MESLSPFSADIEESIKKWIDGAEERERVAQKKKETKRATFLQKFGKKIGWANKYSTVEEWISTGKTLEAV